MSEVSPVRERAQALLDRIDSLVTARDRAGAISAAHEAVRGGAVTIPQLYVLVLASLMRLTGTRWQSGTEAVWEEHYTTGIVRTIVEPLAPAVIEQSVTVPRAGRTVVIGCPEEEYHDLGPRMLFDRFLLAGYDAHFLGANVPSPMTERWHSRRTASWRCATERSYKTCGTRTSSRATHRWNKVVRFRRAQLQCFPDACNASPTTRENVGGTACGARGAAVSAEGDQSRLTDVILQATVALIEESGLDAVTMRSVAGRIGYSPTTIYLHFESKEDLLTSALVYAHEQMAQGLRAAESIDDLRERLRARAIWFVRWGVEHPNIYRQIFEQAPRTPDIWAVAASAREVWRRHQELIAEAMNRGLIRRDVDPSVNAHLWWATLHGIVWFATAIRFESSIFPEDDAGASERAELLAESFVTMMLGAAPEPSR